MLHTINITKTMLFAVSATSSMLEPTWPTSTNTIMTLSNPKIEELVFICEMLSRAMEEFILNWGKSSLHLMLLYLINIAWS